jgi:hypothetical protein
MLRLLIIICKFSLYFKELQTLSLGEYIRSMVYSRTMVCVQQKALTPVSQDWPVVNMNLVFSVMLVKNSIVFNLLLLT